MQTYFASTQDYSALNIRDVPNLTEKHASFVGAPAPVHPIKKNRREGSLLLSKSHKENAVVLTVNSAEKFHSTVIKPYIPNCKSEIQYDAFYPSLQQSLLLETNKAVGFPQEFNFENINRQSLMSSFIVEH